jgi:hypothetical protein
LLLELTSVFVSCDSAHIGVEGDPWFANKTSLLCLVRLNVQTPTWLETQHSQFITSYN